MTEEIAVFVPCPLLTGAGTILRVNHQTDHELLLEYVERQSEAAFAELVRRHVDLVYSAAVRMVRDTSMAKDVTQSVFLALAQNARSLGNCAVLSGWLHRATRNLAVKAIRSDVRRRAREQEAAAMNELSSATVDAPWEHIEPHLDAAIEELSQGDRDALLLRYFERKSAPEMAQLLGISDEAAQKRVSRAVERLREFFAKRGVTVAASGLVIVISAHAVQSAPAGLTAAISTAATLGGTALAGTATLTAAKTIIMTTLQKTLLAAAIIVVGVGTALVVQQQLNQNNPREGASRNHLATAPSGKTNQTEFPQATWKFAGYAEPESGYQSFMWAMSQGNVEITLDSLTPDARAKWEKNMKKSYAELSADLARRTKQTEVFRILDKQGISDSETHLLIESVGASNENPVQEQWARMIKVGTYWKYEGWVGN
jgi:RNA polymerase sigma factor (sigma-70 family)